MQKAPRIDVVGEKPILDHSNDYPDFEKKELPIRHYVLSVEQISGKLVFSASKINERGPARLDEVLELGRQLAQSGSDPHGLQPSPLDMPVCKQCWVIVELDQEINWRFSPGRPAITSKGEEYTHAKTKGHNLWLRHVHLDGRDLPHVDPAAVGPNRCRIAFFAVSHRGHKDFGTDPHHYVNLKVDFFQPGKDGVELVLPCVLDPDVGNEGQQEIP